MAALLLLFLGPLHRPEIKLTADGGRYLVIINYIEGDIIHRLNFDGTGHFEWKMTGAMTANIVVESRDRINVVVKAYIDGRVVDSQIGLTATACASL
jgi:hypothetical protein